MSEDNTIPANDTESEWDAFPGRELSDEEWLALQEEERKRKIKADAKARRDEMANWLANPPKPLSQRERLQQAIDKPGITNPLSRAKWRRNGFAVIPNKRINRPGKGETE